MGFYASWVHGNALTVENPENLDFVGHFGWGGDMRVRPGKQSWFHVALPTPVIVDVRVKLFCVFLQFLTENGGIHNVHVYDGPTKIQAFDGLSLKGDHLSGLADGINKFNLPTPHSVTFGIGVSFLFVAATGTDSPIKTRLLLASAGGDYKT